MESVRLVPGATDSFLAFQNGVLFDITRQPSWWFPSKTIRV